MLLFRRLEVKYLVDRPTRTALTHDLVAFMRPDVHAGPDGFYLVRSCYFDTHDYMAYHEKLAGHAVRHKLRTRVYGVDPGQTPLVRLEVKSRYLEYVHKTTVDVPREDHDMIQRAIWRKVLPPVGLLSEKGISVEFFRIQRQYNMDPRILIQYRRQAFERQEIGRVRANFDDELLATGKLDLLGPMRGARRLMEPGYSIFELKVDEALPYWMHALIAKYDLQNQAVCKYCHAVSSRAFLSHVEREDEAA
jgi:hypothetical protein